MRLLLPGLLVLPLLVPPVQAGPVPRTDAPAEIAERLAAEAEAQGLVLDGAIGWEMDFEGDGTTEWLVQGIYPFPGGNAVQVRTFLFDGADAGYADREELDLPRSLKAVDQDGTTIKLILYEMREGDARCCPSGESYRMLFIQP